mmetsp:Transcript_99484/g.197137  ORF Transcript_99484/g.197137 Transcript_99484/m.197137 type:complete len:314 (-) Transcript_99484:61-1002(-)
MSVDHESAFPGGQPLSIGRVDSDNIGRIDLNSLGDPALSGAPWSEEDEDLAECIAAWQENSHKTSDVMRILPSRASNRDDMRKDPISPPRPASPPRAKLPSSQVLSINVGGTVFTTTASTIRKSRFLEELLHQHTGNKVLNELFVDRSGDLFQYILNFMRAGRWLLFERSSDLEFVEALREEAAFYGITEPMHPPAPQVTEHATIWQFRDEPNLYVDCCEQTIREDPAHQGLFRLCKHFGGLPLDQIAQTKRFKLASHSLQSGLAYFAMRGFRLDKVVESSTIIHITSADGQTRCGHGTQYILVRPIVYAPLA